jgi:ABC-type nickel/cobalt efflux system permease component RcnA
MKKLLLAFLCCGVPGLAHPMGNFSVNHYARIEAGPNGVEIRYVLDLAEIPTFELLQKWNLQAASPRAELERHAAAEAREWVAGLKVIADGRAITPRFDGAELATADGAGGLPVYRITSRLHVAAKPGKLEYEDRNFDGRAGWKEIVIAARAGATLEKASQGDQDRSQGLTAYPQDPMVAPPQDLRAALEWSAGPVTVTEARKPVIVPLTPAPAVVAPPVSPAPTSPVAPEQKTLGTVNRGDFLSRTLRNRDIPFGLALICIAVAFGLGALHAFEPGHGKTMVAAYLVGSRGTPKHALFLGGMVTFTHTISVFILGFVTLFLSQYVMPDKISKVLGVLSGVSIVWIGGLLLYRRSRKLADHSHHHHDHDHAHDHHHHDHAHDHHHDHDHHGHSHTHDGHTHSHVPEGEISLGSLAALGASGGLVPCPSALVLLLSAISIGHTGLGLLLLLAFSVGLAIVLMATGLMVLYAKNLLPERHRSSDNRLFRLLPVFSAAFIVCIGLLMTGVSLGVIPASRFLG